MRPYVNWKESLLGKRIDRDKAAGFQCADLARAYMAQVLGINKVMGNAKEARLNKFKSFDKDWQQIKGTKDLMQGDIIFATKGTYGHVAIVDHIADGKIYVLEQNGSGKNSGSGLGANAIRVKGYPFSFWAGVWRCKKIFDNLQIERAYCDSKGTPEALEYKQTLRYLAK